MTGLIGTATDATASHRPAVLVQTMRTFATLAWRFRSRSSPTRHSENHSRRIAVAWLFAVFALPWPLAAQDADSFWRATRERLASETMEAQVEAVVEPLPYKKFKVTLRSL